MAAASWQQSSFLGGEWSLNYQGRIDDPRYSTALSTCLNAFPLETGGWTRRQGTQWAGFTRSGAAGRCIAFPFFETSPYVMEFTDGHLRLWAGQKLVTTVSQGVISVSGGVIETATNHGWATGDQVLFSTTNATIPTAGATLFNRVWSITVTGAQTFTIVDATTGATITPYGGLTNLYVAKVIDFATVYTGGSWANIQAVLDGQSAILLCPGIQPYVLTVTGSPAGANPFYTFSFAVAQFIDGPYLDPVYSNTLTFSNTTFGSQTVSFASTQGINGGAGFTSTDVGRCFRFLLEPPSYSATATYSGNAQMSYPKQYAGTQGPIINGYQGPGYETTEYYINNSSGSFTGVAPPGGNGGWVIAGFPYWIWGTITAVSSATQITVNIQSACPEAGNSAGNPGMPYLTQTTFQLGAYTNTPDPITGLPCWPTCGTYHEGRLWLGGAIQNRFDSSASNETFVFSPSALYQGTVSDNNAISYTLDSSDANYMVWMFPDNNGIVCATEAGEWLVQASTLSEPLTPTSIQAHRVTKIGCAPSLPVRTGVSLVFIQKFRRRLMEFLSDVFTGKYMAPNLSEAAQHLSINYIEEIAYQEETTPIVWARTSTGELLGMCYRRVSTFLSEAPKFVGWHRHILGSTSGTNQNLVKSLSIGPSANGLLDSLCLVTMNPATDYYQVEFLTPGFDEGTATTAAWFLDQAVAPASVQITLTGGTPTAIVCGSLDYAQGRQVRAFIGGLDCGTYTVNAGGTITVPFAADQNGLCTYAYLVSLSANAANLNFGLGAVTDYTENITFPCVIGRGYTSQGQLMRPQLPQQTGAMNGPALGKTRRIHQAGLYVVDAQDLTVGTDFVTMHACNFASPSGIVYNLNQLYSGVYWAPLENTYSFDGQVAWQCARGYPCTVAGVNLFIQTQDRT